MTAGSKNAHHHQELTGRTMIRTLVTILAITVPAVAAAAQEPASPPSRLPSSGGEVLLPTEVDRNEYARYHFAQVRRAGDYLYVSGVIAGRREGEGRDVEAFKAQVRRAFRRIQTDLAAGGASFADVVMINSFHVWSGPNFTGTRDEQFAAFSAVKDEFMPPPHPAWTAVGTTGLLADGGIVEIQMIAYAPR
jgi:enamine deaminase RidA (YjgF/YER057c/UK114 family)